MLATLQHALSNNGGKPLEVDIRFVGDGTERPRTLTAFDQHGIVLEVNGLTTLVPWHRIDTLYIAR